MNRKSRRYKLQQS